MQGDVVARRLVWVSLAGQALFTIGWIVAGALEPGYSVVRDDVGSLGGSAADHQWIGIAAMAALAVGIAALGPALARVLPARRTLAAGAFVVAGLATLAWAVLPVDCALTAQSCQDRLDAGLVSWHHSAHLWVGLAMSLAILGTTVALVAALWPRPAAVLALGAGVSGLVISVLTWVAWDHGGDGVLDRIGILLMHVWLVGVAVGVLHAARGSGPVPEATPLRPRDFFGRDWEGSGEFVLWPFWLWRSHPNRFRVHRTATWFSDEAWTFEDRADFENGWSETRIRFCRFDSPTHVSVVSTDLPDGADVVIDEGGYRIMPFRMVMPIGPLPLAVRCRDEGRVEGDGTVVETVTVRFAGIAVARAVMRVRPVAPVGEREPSERAVAAT